MVPQFASTLARTSSLNECRSGLPTWRGGHAVLADDERLGARWHRERHHRHVAHCGTRRHEHELFELVAADPHLRLVDAVAVAVLVARAVARIIARANGQLPARGFLRLAADCSHRCTSAAVTRERERDRQRAAVYAAAWRRTSRCLSDRQPGLGLYYTHPQHTPPHTPFARRNTVRDIDS